MREKEEYMQEKAVSKSGDSTDINNKNNLSTYLDKLNTTTKGLIILI